MKFTLFVAVFAVAASVFAADAAKDNKPKLPAEPNPYAGYGAAMATDKKYPMAAEWQETDRAKIDEATEDSVIADFAADAESADELLKHLNGAYDTYPIVMTQIAAVTQWVMTEEPCWLCFWKPSPSEGRAIWVRALERKMNSTNDLYIRTFCRQQLDLCK